MKEQNNGFNKKDNQLTSSYSGLIRQHTSELIILRRLIDVIVIGVTLWAVVEMQLREWDALYTWWLLVSIFSFQIVAEFNNLYKESRGASQNEGIKQIIVSWFCAIVIILLIDQFIQVIIPIDKPIFIFWCIAVPVELISWHIISKGLVDLIRKMGRNSRRVAIVGNTRLGHELKEIFQQEEWMGLSFVGFFDARKTAREKEQEQLTGDIKQIIAMAKAGEVDIIYITLALKAENRIKEILSRLSDTTASVFYVPDLFGFDLLRSNISYIQGIPVVSVYDTPFFGVDGVLKRTFDIVMSLVILSIIFIPLLIIALLVMLTSPGGAIFKQRRYGFRGEEITVWKFRSMTVGKDSENVQQATKLDPRVTKLGAFLRRTSLDELPQFINVLQGRMSIVGPRPHAVVHNEFYRGQINGYMLRHKVKPGITGLAQISGFRGETDTLDKMEGRVRYDLEYIRNWSLWLDFKIVFLTMFKGFVGKQAY